MQRREIAIMRRIREPHHHSSRLRFAALIACVLAAISIAPIARASENCPGDIVPGGVGNVVNIDDLLFVINNWGPCPPPCPAYCTADIIHSCNVNIDDLLKVINTWGPCPACPADAMEPNEVCGQFKTLLSVGSNQTQTYTTLTLHNSADVDFFRIVGNETDSSCSCCDGGFCLDEDFQLKITLTVPAASAVAYSFCSSLTNCNETANCVNVLPGQTSTFTYNLDGACGGGGSDSYSAYVRIKANTVGFTGCGPYTLMYQFTPGCFGGLDQPDGRNDSVRAD